MAEGDPAVGTINELKIWIAGQFDLVRQAQTTSGEDLRNVRKSVHDLSNTVAGLTALDIPGKLEKYANEIKEQDAAIRKLAEDGILNKSAIASVKAIYGISGILLGATGALLARLIFGA